MRDQPRGFNLAIPLTATAPPEPPPAPSRLPLPADDVLRARVEALRSAAITSERSAPAGMVLDRAAEYEAWLTRGRGADG